MWTERLGKYKRWSNICPGKKIDTPLDSSDGEFSTGLVRIPIDPLLVEIGVTLLCVVVQSSRRSL